MQVNVNKLKSKLTAKGINVEEFAEMCGIERSSLYRKLKKFEKITIGEAQRMKTALDLSDEEAIEIFLS